MRVPLTIFCKYSTYLGHYSKIPQTRKVINKTKLFFTVVESEKSKTKALAGWKVF